MRLYKRNEEICTETNVLEFLLVPYRQQVKINSPNCDEFASHTPYAPPFLPICISP